MQAVFQNEVLGRLPGMFFKQLIQVDFADVQTVRHFFDRQMIADVLVNIADSPADQIAGRGKGMCSWVPSVFKIVPISSEQNRFWTIRQEPNSETEASSKIRSNK